VTCLSHQILQIAYYPKQTARLDISAIGSASVAKKLRIASKIRSRVLPPKPAMPLLGFVFPSTVEQIHPSVRKTKPAMAQLDSA